MKNFQILREIKITPDGDISLDENDGIEVSVGGDALAEHIMVRIRTIFNEALNMPGVGSNLDEAAGLPNTPDTGAFIEQEVIDSLTRDGFMQIGDFNVNVVPTSMDSISVYIDPDPENTGSFGKVISFDINLKNGEIS